MKARAFSAFESTEGSGVLGLYPCKVRAFPVLPPLYQRLGRSRPSSLHQSTGGPGSASAFHPKRIGTVSEGAHHGTRPFKRTTQCTARRRPPATDPRCSPPDVTAPRARQPPHAFRNRDSTRLRRSIADVL